MKKESYSVILIFIGAILFNLVFWEEKLAVNTVIFDAFGLTALFRLYPESLKNNTVKWLLSGHLICLAMLVFHNTALSIFAFVFTLLVLVGFTEYSHRSAWYAGGSVMLNFVLFVASFLQLLKNRKPVTGSKLRVFRIIKIAILPLLLCFIFFVLYGLANTVFSDILSRAGLYVEQFFMRFFEPVFFARILFSMVGLYLTGSLLLKTNLNYFSHRDSMQKDNLERTRLPQHLRNQNLLYQFLNTTMGGFSKGIMALKNENVIGIASLALLNILLLLVNIIDIKYVWLHFEYSPGTNISDLVHEGAGLLIVSIIMAMLVLLFFFKGNLNFYQNNKWLKYGAYLWIFQNAILVFSVFMRDYYYISKYGLAYKRIGVLFFLLMVLIGLITVAIKIYYRKTSYYLFRINAWAGLVVLILSTTIHWDEMMAKYNLAHRNSVAPDISFLLSLSDKTLPLLEKEIDLIKQQELQAKKPEDNDKESCEACYTEILARRERIFLEKQDKYSWLSWNYSDHYVSAYFERKKSKGISQN